MKFTIALAAALAAIGAAAPVPVHGTQPIATAPSPAILLEGTIVTMNAARDVIENGRVLVRDGRIVAIWRGPKPPSGVSLDGALRAPLGPRAHIYPGLINLHDHPFFDMLPMVQPPSSHRQPSLGRPAGTEPYANRYQWNSGPAQSIEAKRLITNPATVLEDGALLNRSADVAKFAKVRMILGGTTTTQGGLSDPRYDTLLARNADSANFGRQRILSRVGAIGGLGAAEAATIAGGMSAGLVDAWIVHLAEGVRDADRRPGDTFSSRAEFADLKAKHLLTDATVIVHGVGLEPADFDEMAQAPVARADGAGDRRGAKLVWSPLSNLLLYGKTAAVYDARAAGVLVSLGTDWTPSGSPNLLTELKVADRALRDASVLGNRRHLVPELTGHGDAERALDQWLVEMVTINPAMTARWDDQVGSIEAGKIADLLVVDAPQRAVEPGVPESPYRRLIDATERDVALVMVGGTAVAGDVDVMSQLKPADFEVVHSAAGCFDKAIDVTDASLPDGGRTLAQISASLRDAMRALGGDDPQPAGRWSYLKANIPGAAGLPDAAFTFGLLFYLGANAEGHPNIEAMAPPPLFSIDDDWWFATLGAVREPATGLTIDPNPPYARYASNANQMTAFGNPFAAAEFQDRWYSARCVARN